MMPIGAMSNVSDDDTTVSQGDSAELRGWIYDDEHLPMVADDIAYVEFTIQDPDGSKEVNQGTVEDDGTGFYRFLSTDVLGKYLWRAKFVLSTGQVKSYTDEFSVYDPFANIIPTAYEAVSDAVWLRLEDCFDSDEGGPWLRDMTLGYFDKSKIPKFVNEAILLINYTGTITSLDADYFFTPIDPNSTQITLDYTHDPDAYIIVEATLLATIKHLMRSYTEQPDISGAQVVRQVRRDYLQRWGTIYQIESDAFKSLLTLWKRQFLNFGHGKLLVHNKAGRLTPPGQRTRNVGRGGY